MDGLMYDTRQGTNLVPIPIASSGKHRVGDDKTNLHRIGGSRMDLLRPSGNPLWRR